MIVRSFLAWYDSARSPERIEAVRMMAQCTLAGELGGDSMQEAESALTLVLDDPSISVRSALAWELVMAGRAPRHLVLALAHDHPEVSSLVLARSAQLTEADLVECARHGDALTHLAIASRLTVAARVAAALAAVAGPKALAALLENPGAEIEPETFRVILSRHECDATLREALNQRPDLPVDVRQQLIAAVSRDLLGFVQQRGWLGDRRAERAALDAREGATIALAAEADDLARFIAHLAATGQLTSSLLIRSLLTGDTSLFGAALVCLSDVVPNRVAGMLRGKAGSALAATCVRAGLPRTLVPVFTAALSAIADLPRDFVPDGQTLQRPIINQVIAACVVEDADELRPVLAVLRRLDADLARTEARAQVERLKANEPVLLDAMADALIDADLIAADADLVAEMTDVAETSDVAELPELVPVELPEPVVFELRGTFEPWAEQALETETAQSAFVEQEWTEQEWSEPAFAEQEFAAEAFVDEPVVLHGELPADQDRAPQRMIGRTPIRVHDDLEALLEQLYAEERAFGQALRVVDGQTPMDERFFNGRNRPATAAAA